MTIFNADDYGINLQQSDRILFCNRNGCLNGISIMPNSRWLKESIDMLDNTVKVKIHLNFIEGKCCASKEKIPLLVDNEGKFKLSYKDMLILSLIWGKDLRKQVKEECMAQIQRVCQVMEKDYKVGIDSHMHYHMIPVVFRGLYDACMTLDVKIGYIRWPVEPFIPFLKHIEIWRNISCINLVKSILLHIFGIINYPILVKAGWKKKTAVFFGVLFSGRMFYNPVRSVLPEFELYAKRKRKDLEVLFHPGGIYNGEEYLDDKYIGYYQMKNRSKEGKALIKLRIQGR